MNANTKPGWAVPSSPAWTLSKPCGSAKTSTMSAAPRSSTGNVFELYKQKVCIIKNRSLRAVSDPKGIARSSLESKSVCIQRIRLNWLLTQSDKSICSGFIRARGEIWASCFFFISSLFQIKRVSWKVPGGSGPRRFPISAPRSVRGSSEARPGLIYKGFKWFSWIRWILYSAWSWFIVYSWWSYSSTKHPFKGSKMALAKLCLRLCSSRADRWAEIWWLCGKSREKILFYWYCPRSRV